MINFIKEPFALRLFGGYLLVVLGLDFAFKLSFIWLFGIPFSEAIVPTFTDGIIFFTALAGVFILPPLLHHQRQKTSQVLTRLATLGADLENDAFFNALVTELRQATGQEAAFIGRYERPKNRLCGVKVHSDHPPVSSCLVVEDAPWEIVLHHGARTYSDGLDRHFTNVRWDTTFSVQGFAGVPILSPEGKTLGMVAVASQGKLRSSPLQTEALQICAARSVEKIDSLTKEKGETDTGRWSVPSSELLTKVLHLSQTSTLITSDDGKHILYMNHHGQDLFTGDAQSGQPRSLLADLASMQAPAGSGTSRQDFCLLIAGRRYHSICQKMALPDGRAAHLTVLKESCLPKKTDEIKTGLLGSVGHEMRTPLTAILGYAELMLQLPSSPEQNQAYLARVQNAGKRLEKLIADFTAISRIPLVRDTAQYAQADLTLLCKRVLNESNEVTEGLEPQLQAPAAPLHVWAHREQLHLTVHQLVSLTQNTTTEKKRGILRLKKAGQSAQICLYCPLQASHEPNQAPKAPPVSWNKSQHSSALFAQEVVDLHQGTFRARDLAAGWRVLYITLPLANSATVASQGTR